MGVDEKDRRILRLLQSDMTKSYKKIADELGLPVTTLYNRVKKMEEDNIILGYSPILNHKKLGVPITSFLLITVTFKDRDNNSLDVNALARRISEYTNVQDVHVMAGEWDILVKLKTRNVRAVGDFINEELRQMTGIDKCLSSIAFSTQKETLDIPI